MQKQIAQTLDRKAANANAIDQRPATGKQCWFLAKLIIDEAKRTGAELADWETWTDLGNVLTCKQASFQIDIRVTA